MNERFDYNFDHYLCFRDHPRPLRSDKRLKFEPRKPPSTNCKKSFFTQTMSLINRLPKNLNFQDLQGLKERLLNYFRAHLGKNYNELVSDPRK